MSAPRLTRRSLLAAGAGAAAGGLTHSGAAASGLIGPAGGLAALAGPPRPSLSRRWVERLGAGAVRVELGRPADLVAVQWPARAAALIELRFRAERGGWTRWVSAMSCCGGAEH